MCVGDWRLGSRIRSSVHHHTLGIGAAYTLPANAQRVGVAFWGTQASTVAGTWGTISIGGVEIARLGASVRHKFWTIQENGDLVTKQMVYTAGGAGDELSVHEFFLPQEFLAAAYEQFVSEYSEWLKRY